MDNDVNIGKRSCMLNEKITYLSLHQRSEEITYILNNFLRYNSVIISM